MVEAFAAYEEVEGGEGLGLGWTGRGEVDEDLGEGGLRENEVVDLEAEFGGEGEEERRWLGPVWMGWIEG